MKQKRFCTIENCGRRHYAKELCKRHYELKRRQDNPEHTRLVARKWRRANTDKVRASDQRFRKTHPERVAEWSRRHSRAHPEQRRAIDARRRARKALTICDLSMVDQRKLLARGCFFGGQNCEGPLNLAHDVAVSKGGNTTLANVLCLCKRHNSMMGTKGLAEILIQRPLEFGES